MNRKLRTAVTGALALAALAAGGINSGLAPHSTLSPDAYKAPGAVATSFGPDAYKAPVVVGTSCGPALSYGPVADSHADTSFGPVALQRGGVADDRPVADVCPDSTLRPAGRLLASL